MRTSFFGRPAALSSRSKTLAIRGIPGDDLFRGNCASSARAIEILQLAGLQIPQTDGTIACCNPDFVIGRSPRDGADFLARAKTARQAIACNVAHNQLLVRRNGELLVRIGPWHCILCTAQPCSRGQHKNACPHAAEKLAHRSVSLPGARLEACATTTMSAMFRLRPKSGGRAVHRDVAQRTKCAAANPLPIGRPSTVVRMLFPASGLPHGGSRDAYSARI